MTKQVLTPEERVEEQLRLEGEMFNSGIDRFHERIAATKSRINKVGNRVQVKNESSTTYGKELLRTFIDDVIDEIALKLEDLGTPRGGGQPVALQYMKQIPVEIMGYVTTKCVLDTITQQSPVQSVARHIADRLEDQVRLARFKSENSAYFDAIMADQKKKKIVDYNHRKRTLVHCERKTDISEWSNWPIRDKVHLGVVLIECFHKATGLIERALHRKGSIKTTRAVIRPTAQCMEWVQDNIHAMEVLAPQYGPCVAQPIPWTSPTYGGFHTRELRRTCPMVNVKSNKRHLALMARPETVQQMGTVYASVNALQRTRWSVNARVLDVAMDFFKRGVEVGIPSAYPVDIPKYNEDRSRAKFIEDPEEGVVLVDAMDPRYDKGKFLYEEDRQAFIQYKEECVALHENEQERRGRCMSVSRTILMASRMRDYDYFHFVYQCDFRGRKYAISPDLNPQGDDLNKGLLQFGEGYKLGPDGLTFMRLQLANVYGYDKDDYAGRVQWVVEHEDKILSIGKDPYNRDVRGWWSKADKPWQFLAVAMEYVEAREMEDPSEYVSHLGWAQDGSCNGIQHYSMILRDSIGGSAVNLVNHAKPADIYGVVAEQVHDHCTRLVERGGGWSAFYAQAALDIGITRKVTKRSVMILPYGGTTSACREYLTEFYKDHFRKTRKDNPTYVLPFGGRQEVGVGIDGKPKCEGGIQGFITFFSAIVWKYIGSTVVAARAAMQWLQKQTRVLARGPVEMIEDPNTGKKKKVYGKGNPIMWTVKATGFPVCQQVFAMSTRRVRTHLFGECSLVVTEETDTINPNRMANSIAPNFIHSMDAAHQDLSVTAAYDEGIRSFWNVHDSFMVPFGQSGRFAQIIREQFYALHTEHLVLEEWRDEQLESHPWATIEETPEMGDLNPEEVLTADYLFG